jgi:adenylate kinase
LQGILGVTGTPGTGKKSIAPLVARRLGVKCLGLNELARTRGLSGVGNSEEVDVQELRRTIEKEIPDRAVVFGHLLPYTLARKDVSRVAVLRCEPRVLKERLRARGYASDKIVENIEAELIGVISSDAFDAYGGTVVFEVDTTSTSPSEASAEVAHLFRGDKPPGPRVDWTRNYDTGAKLRLLLSMGD